MTIDISLPPAVTHVLSAIRSAGGRPVLAGGCVRDALLGLPGKDIDIEAYGIAGPDELARALDGTGHVTEAGRLFGVFKVRFPQMPASRLHNDDKVQADGIEIDVSLPRRESKAGAGHRGFDVLPDGAMGFAEASARRDYTINAMMADPFTGELIDCHGGLADLRAGTLRHTSPAFAEDPLRVLRGMQFAARFGFTMTPETAALCRQLRPAYSELSVERVWGEWEKLGTRGVHVSKALHVLWDTGWERHFPQLAALHGIPQEPAWHPEGDVWTHTRLAADQGARLADEAGLTGTDRLGIVFAALLHDLGKATHTFITPDAKGRLRITSHGHAEAGVKPAREFLTAIGCPEAIITHILPVIREHMNCMSAPNPSAVRRLARRLAPATMTQLALVCAADAKGRGNPDAVSPAEAWLEVSRGLNVEDRPARGLLTGHHLIAAGMKPGPAFKEILAAAVAAQDDGEFDDEAGAIRWFAAQAT